MDMDGKTATRGLMSWWLSNTNYLIVSSSELTSSSLAVKSKSKKTLFNVGQCKQYNINSHLKWVLVADKGMHMVIYNKVHIK